MRTPRLLLSLVLALACSVQAFAITAESESNNSESSADGPLVSGTTVNASISTTRDLDWYYFDVAAAGTITVTLNHTSGRDFDFDLYRTTGSAVLTRATSQRPETGSYSAPAAERYYIKVSRYSGTGSYTLNVTFPGSGSGGGGTTPPPPSNTRPSKPSDLTVYITGNSADSSRQPVNGPAIVLMGGNFDIDETFVNRVYPIVNGGDVVVLRTSGTNGYNDYLYNLRKDSLRPDSVETMIVNTRTKANSAYVKWVLDTAEFIYLAGGDQSDYLNFWAGTEVETSMRAAYARGAVLGGISAGCAVMGQFIYDPDGVTAATSAEAIANPYRSSMIISDTLLNAPVMANIITDTHFAQRDRMGRLMAFMARLRQDGRASTIVGVGVDEDTALFIDRNRQAVVDGDFAVYILREDSQTARTRVTSGQSLIYTNVLRTKLTAGDTYNFSTNASNRSPIRLSVDGRNSQPYNPTNPY